MYRRKYLGYFFIIAIVLLVLHNACFKEEFDPDKVSTRFEWDPGLKAPLGYGSISITDLVKSNDSTIVFNGDSIEIVYREDSLFSFEMADFLEIPDQEEKIEEFELGERTIEADTIIRVVTLDELTNDMGEPERSDIRGKDQTDDIFPAVPLQDLGDFDLEPVENFTWVEFSHGFLSGTINNNMPVEITTLTIELKNTIDGSLVATFVYTNIPPGGEQTREADISGKLMRNDLTATVINFSSPGSLPGTVFIDLQDDVTMTMVTRDLEILRGNAILPYQIITNDTSDIPLTFTNDEEATLLVLESGLIDYHAYSYVSEDIFFNVILPTGTKNGETVTEGFIISQIGEATGTIDLSEAVIEVEEGNTIPVIYQIELYPSGQLVDFDFSDSINYISKLVVSNVNLEAIEGYFGQDLIEIEQNEFDLDLDFITNFEGSFVLTNPSIIFPYENSYGIPFNVNLSLIGDYGSGDVVNLEPPALQFELPENRDAPAVSGDLLYDKENTLGMDNFLRFPPPDKLVYSGIAGTNPQGKTGTPNFVTKDSKVSIGLELNLPLEIKADNIQIQDTVKISLSQEDEEQPEGGQEIEFKKSILHYRLKNGFPLDLSFQVVLYDSITDQTFDTLDVDLLTAAAVDSRGIVLEETISEVQDSISMDDTFMDHLLNDANKLILIGSLSTYKDETDTPQSVKILTTYAIEYSIGIEAEVSYIGSF